MNKKSLPTFHSIAEEAHFWDTHDVTDYLDELEMVQGDCRPATKAKTADLTEVDKKS